MSPPVPDPNLRRGLEPGSRLVSPDDRETDATTSMLGAGVMDPPSLDGAALGTGANSAEAKSGDPVAPPPRVVAMPGRTRLALILAALAMLGPFSIDNLPAGVS